MPAREGSPCLAIWGEALGTCAHVRCSGPGGRRPGAGTWDAGRPHVPAAGPRRPSTPTAPAAVSAFQSRLQHAVSSLQLFVGAPAARLAGRLHAPAGAGAGAGRCCSPCGLTSSAPKWPPGVLQRLRQRSWGERLLLVAGCEIGICTPSPLPLCRRRPRAARQAWWRPLPCS